MVILCRLVQWNIRIPLNAVLTFESVVTGDPWFILENTMFNKHCLLCNSLLSLVVARSPIAQDLSCFVVYGVLLYDSFTCITSRCKVALTGFITCWRKWWVRHERSEWSCGHQYTVIVSMCRPYHTKHSVNSVSLCYSCWCNNGSCYTTEKKVFVGEIQMEESEWKYGWIHLSLAVTRMQVLKLLYVIKTAANKLYPSSKKSVVTNNLNVIIETWHLDWLAINF